MLCGESRPRPKDDDDEFGEEGVNKDPVFIAGSNLLENPAK